MKSTLIAGPLNFERVRGPGASAPFAPLLKNILDTYTYIIFLIHTHTCIFYINKFIKTTTKTKM